MMKWHRKDPIQGVEAGRFLNRRRLDPLEVSGGAIIEVAIAIPILVLLLVGAAELGRLSYYAIEVSSAAYAGASYAAQNHGTAVSTANIATAATQDAANIRGLITASTVSCYCSDGTTVTCTDATTDCVSPARISEYVQVNTSAQVSPIFAYPGISNTWTLHGSSTMRVQQ
jgi:Flp pilus assembly protein TadG